MVASLARPDQPNNSCGYCSRPRIIQLCWTVTSKMLILPTGKRPGYTPHVPHRTRRHRLRHPPRRAEPSRPAPLSLRPLARRRRPARRARAGIDRLPRQFAAHLAPRLAPAQRQARLRSRRAARPRAHAVRHQHRDLQLPLRRAAAVQRGHGRRLRPRGERLDRRRVAGQGAAPARLHRGADAERRTGGRGDQPRRARPALRADPAAGDARPSRWASVTTGRSTPRPRSTACRSASTPAPPIATRSRRSAGRPTTPRTTPRRPPAFQAALSSPGLRGRVHQVSRPEGRAAGIRLHLAARASLAADEILARAAHGGAVGGPRAHRHRAQQRAPHHAALRRAADRRRCSSG